MRLIPESWVWHHPQNTCDELMSGKKRLSRGHWTPKWREPGVGRDAQRASLGEGDCSKGLPEVKLDGCDPGSGSSSLKVPKEDVK